AEIKEKDKVLESLLYELSTLIYREQTLRQQIDAIQAELNEIGETSSRHEKTFTWDGYSSNNPAQVSESFSVAEKIQHELVTVEDEIQTLDVLIVKKNHDCDRFEKAVLDLKIQLKGKEAEYSILKDQIRILSPVDYISGFTDIIQGKIHELKNRVEAAKIRFEEWTEKNTVLND